MQLWEEMPDALESDHAALKDAHGRKPSHDLVPRTLHHFTAPDAELRALAIGTLNLAAGYRPASLEPLIDSYVQGLFSLAHDPSPLVRKAVCNGLVLLLSLVPEKLNNNMGDIIEYMMTSMKDEDESVAVNASEFWSALAESHFDVVGVLRPFLPRLLPMLLTNMVGSLKLKQVPTRHSQVHNPIIRVFHLHKSLIHLHKL